MPNQPNRRSIRLKGYDYSQEGLYFLTLCFKTEFAGLVRWLMAKWY